MKPASLRLPQRGIGLPAAIFVITLMVIISIAINRLVGQSAQTFEEQINLTRAFYAAESGAGFLMNGIYPPEEFSAYAGSTCPATPVNYNFTAEGLNQCSVTASCDDSVVISGKTYITIESTGMCGDITRKVQVRTAF